MPEQPTPQLCLELALTLLEAAENGFADGTTSESVANNARRWTEKAVNMADPEDVPDGE